MNLSSHPIAKCVLQKFETSLEWGPSP